MTIQTPVYLDYAATTPVDPVVIEKMRQCLGVDNIFGNPASAGHPYGWQAAQKIDQAREQVASLLNADAREIVWTSGATEANNLAILGVARFYQNNPQSQHRKHIITMQSEHKAVLDPCKHLEQNGFDVTYLAPESNGLLDLEKLKQALRPETLLVSVMYVNNETGVIQDIPGITRLVKLNDSFMHVDAVQAIGKVEIDLDTLPVDLLSMTAHKIYGPKGVGALYVRRKPVVRLQPLIFGGGHEKGLRSGTLPTHQIAGMGEAFALAKKFFIADNQRIENLKNKLWQGIRNLPGVGINGVARADDADITNQYQVSGILNLHFKHIDGDFLMKALPQLALATGSACNSAVVEPSHVLQSMGIDDELAHSSLRFSIGRFTTEEEVDFVVNLLCEKLPQLV